MLQKSMHEHGSVPFSSPVSGPGSHSGGGGSSIVLRDLGGILRRRRAVIIISLTLSFACAFAYLFATPTRYLAQTVLMLDSRRFQLMPQQSVLGELGVEASAVDSQIEVIRSQAVALSVVRALRLYDEPEFYRSQSTIAAVADAFGVKSHYQRARMHLDQVISVSSARSADDEQENYDTRFYSALSYYYKNLKVYRVGRSVAVAVSFESLDSKRAAQVTNAVAQAYIDDQVNSKYDATKRASDWLKERLEELRRQAVEADRQTADFRVQNNMSTREAQAEVRLLESRANSFRSMHDNFAQRLVETTQQESIPTTEARIITEALGGAPSAPNRNLAFAFALMAGLGVGGAAALLKELTNKVPRTAQDVEDATGLPVVGQVPMLRLQGGADMATRESRIRAYAAEVPLSPFAEALRFVKVATDTAVETQQMRIIGIAGTVVGEGATTIAWNLANIAAASGQRTLLIDADMRRGEKSGTRVDEPHFGLAEILRGEAELSTAVQRGSEHQPDVLYACAVPITQPTEALLSDRMSDLVNDARAQYDYMVIDLPPIQLYADAYAVASQIDGFILVVECGKTPLANVKNSLVFADALRNRAIGAVLNKMRMR